VGAVQNMPPGAVAGEVLLEAVIDGGPVVLIACQGNKYYVNGALLHQDFSFILSHLVGANTLGAPSSAYITHRSDIVAVMASNEPTSLVLSLPGWTSDIDVLELDENGAVVRDGSATMAARYETLLGAQHLLILRRPIHTSARRFHMY
jgi:hypothetical protein